VKAYIIHEKNESKIATNSESKSSINRQ
jgi:hypothetical protein